MFNKVMAKRDFDIEELEYTDLTFEVCQRLILQGVDEDEVSALVYAILRVWKYNMNMNPNSYTFQSWQNDLEDMLDYVIKDIKAKKVKEFQLNKNMQKMRNEIGVIYDKQVKDYRNEINTIEFSLYTSMLLYNLSPKEMLFPIKCVCNRLYGYIHNESYNFFTGIDKRIYMVIETLEGLCNPYVNNAVKEIVKENVKLDHSQDNELYTPMIKCLQRVYKDIEYWEKRKGRDGYSTYLRSRFDEIIKCSSTSAYKKDTLMLV